METTVLPANTPLPAEFKVLELNPDTGRYEYASYKMVVTRRGIRWVGVNQKGGVAKTTTIINVADQLVRAGLRVLVLDMDEQANATKGLGVDSDSAPATMYEVLHPKIKERVPMAEAIVEIKPGLDLVPAHLAMAEIAEYGAGPNTEMLLTRQLRPHKESYHAILIDCPPNLGRLTVMSMSGGGEDQVNVMVPVKCGPFELDGLAKLLDTVDGLKESGLGDNLDIAAVIATMYDSRRILDRDVDQYLQANFPDEHVTRPIRGSVRIAESPGKGILCADFSPHEEVNGDVANLGYVMAERTLA